MGYISLNNGARKQYEYPNDTIMIDSGASEHAVNDKSFFRTLDPGDNVALKLADGSSAGAIARATVLVELQYTSLLLRNVYLVPYLKSNILPRSRPDWRGIPTQIAWNNCTSYYRKERNQIVGKAALNKKEGLYYLRIIYPQGK